MNSDFTYDVLIVGAGISGISAGNYLAKNNLSVKLIDKGKAPGGRLASKRIKYENEKVVFDYGCKYISMDDTNTGKEIMSLVGKNLIKKWNFADSDQKIKNKSQKIIGRESIRSIALQLSRDLDIINNSKVISINRQGELWQLEINNNEMFYASDLILTMPVPQILELFDNSSMIIPKDISFDLNKVEYKRNIVAMLICDSPGNVPPIGGIEFNEGSISFITDNNLKGVNKNKFAFTIEMSDKSSRNYWDYPDEKILPEITKLAENWIGCPVVHSQIHKWKYSQPFKSYPKRFEFIDVGGPIYLAGDAFLGDSAESAYLSGLAAARSLISKNQLKTDEVNL